MAETGELINLAEQLERHVADFTANDEGQIFDLYPDAQVLVAKALRAAAAIERLQAEIEAMRKSRMDEAEGLRFDLRETLKAVLHFFGPEGANKVTNHVTDARERRARVALNSEGKK